MVLDRQQADGGSAQRAMTSSSYQTKNSTKILGNVPEKYDCDHRVSGAFPHATRYFTTLCIFIIHLHRSCMVCTITAHGELRFFVPPLPNHTYFNNGPPLKELARFFGNWQLFFSFFFFCLVHFLFGQRKPKFFA
ncbi:hypothetical protein L228DRAFT_26786 [Xylona heveae TC161]|uniref:Uncharacterized protein n=1 Tax=Xylona heveae (strain CBS 132557 / TC161) TaxID=1328760 RepID=A0A165AF30_XYLHT|nr:hypothetical protein L228DRAFT_26786 [Xylona heveae TC161]KZF20372.1 hypothetical protein L228DRAFT_26786 [Xylona heveae TC161]